MEDGREQTAGIILTHKPDKQRKTSKMVYSDVIAANLILPRKQKYTMRDVKNVMIESLFKPYNGKTIDFETAAFIVKCSAVYHNTDYSNTINTALDKLRSYPL